MDALPVIGRVAYVDLPEYSLRHVPAKIDTGADFSSLWATAIKEDSSGLTATLFGPGSPYYSGEELFFPAGRYVHTRVANSFGDKQLRFKVKIAVRVEGKRIVGTFTLADRSAKTYPILLGRRLLNKKFVVDVSQGKPLKKAEREKRIRMREELKSDGFTTEDM